MFSMVKISGLTGSSHGLASLFFPAEALRYSVPQPRKAIAFCHQLTRSAPSRDAGIKHTRHDDDVYRGLIIRRSSCACRDFRPHPRTLHAVLVSWLIQTRAASAVAAGEGKAASIPGTKERLHLFELRCGRTAAFQPGRCARERIRGDAPLADRLLPTTAVQ